jgi:hypothetical protein
VRVRLRKRLYFQHLIRTRAREEGREKDARGVIRSRSGSG